MLRDKWEFPYAHARLLEAATKKRDHHAERVKWWTEQYTKVTEQIRSEGIQVHESVAKIAGRMSPSNYGTRGYDSEVTIDQRLARDLAETQHKRRWNEDRREAYAGWVALFTMEKEGGRLLDIDDWLFFFGWNPAEEETMAVL